MNNIYRESIEEKFNIPLSSDRAKEILRNINKAKEEHQ